MTRAAIIGSGPNGLSAAITLAQAGVETVVYEARETIGGCARTGEVTLPGFHHDLGSSIYPMGVASPFFQSLPLARYGLRWIEPDAPLAHPLDDGSAVMLEHDVARTADGLGADGPAYRRMMQPLADHWPALVTEILGPLIHLPRHPFLMARFGLDAAFPATALAKLRFHGPRARALFAGNAAHSVLPLENAFSSAVALVLGAAGHAVGWPIAAGGAQSIPNALAAHLLSLGGRIETSHPVASLGELGSPGLGSPDLILADVSPRQLNWIAADELSAKYKRSLEAFQYGPGAFKIDWALSEPIPWKAKDCLRAATVHLGGTLEEIAASERAPWHGTVDATPYVLVAQPSLFDPTRAPAGRHTAWGYCHVPNGFSGSPEEMQARIEAQVERFAPGFRDCILARKVWSAAGFEAWNANLIGGDLSGGAMTLRQLAFRPTEWQYRTSSRRIYLCSASTPPGGAVHGMCGHLAARTALKDLGLGR